jgi:hypothetical protein
MKQNDKPRPIIPTAVRDYIGKKSDNAIVIILIACFVACVIIFLLFLSVSFYERTIRKKAITIDCKLLNRSFKGSTLETNAVPVVGMGMNGGATVGVGLTTSGHGEEFISSFDCGDYGILISDDKEIFRKAKENNWLTVYFGNNDYKILNI